MFVYPICRGYAHNSHDATKSSTLFKLMFSLLKMKILVDSEVPRNLYMHCTHLCVCVFCFFMVVSQNRGPEKMNDLLSLSL